ncbi:terminase [Pseudoalteromonas ruthenica]|uniref:terminase n=1 Tax=Pseudoalteromonas ruthenica TaxID=151081 RepID=UPI00110B8B39|nr:terminase [Pseudoalteromonas ruthenica]TMO87639.1 terminase [Pseudoalteromonas ruthenica]TMP22284.1 terminase [Pseudoalteromonas ruthenica]
MPFAQPSINQDPRYLDFCRRYRKNWVRASVELFGKMPSRQQQKLLKEVQKTGSFTSVSSGHGTGKSDMSSIITMLFMFFHPNARVILVANKIAQVRAAVFKYVKMNWKEVCKRFPWLRPYFVLTETEFHEINGKGVWCVLTKGYRLGNEEALAGEHAKHMLYIVDEASGLSDKAIDIMDGACTETDNRFLMLSQPTRNVGRFFDSHHRLCKQKNPKGKWTSLVFNSEFSPWVTVKYLLDAAYKFGGRNSPQYMIKVRGEFPKTLAGFLTSMTQIEKATSANPELGDNWGWVALCDVGNGRDKSVMLIGKVVGDGLERKFKPTSIKEFGGDIDPIDFGREVSAYINSSNYPNIVVGVDNGGVGSDSAKIMEEAGLRVQRINWGDTMFSDMDKITYINERAYATVMAHRAVKDGRMKVDPSDKTKEQASKIPYKINEKGQYQIYSKEIMREKMGIPSPDRWDTYCFAHLVRYIPHNTEISASVKAERRKVGSWADEMLGDVMQEELDILNKE